MTYSIDRPVMPNACANSAARILSERWEHIARIEIYETDNGVMMELHPCSLMGDALRREMFEIFNPWGVFATKTALSFFNGHVLHFKARKYQHTAPAYVQNPLIMSIVE